jgi:hypothetical protein
VAKKDNKPDRWRRWIIVLAAVAGLCYASFPLGIFINPSHAFTGLVSFLGQTDQPYNWLFDELDVISAVASIFALLVVARRYLITSRLHLWALGLAIVNSLGTLTAALVPLPDEYDDVSIRAVLQAGDVQVIIHGLASFINSAGFVVAAVLWAWAWRRDTNKTAARWRAGLATSMVILSTIGFAVGEWIPATSPTIQRLFIFSYAVWLTIFVYDMTKHVRREKKFRQLFAKRLKK